ALRSDLSSSTWSMRFCNSLIAFRLSADDRTIGAREVVAALATLWACVTLPPSRNTAASTAVRARKRSLNVDVRECWKVARRVVVHCVFIFFNCFSMLQKGRGFSGDRAAGRNI